MSRYGPRPKPTISKIIAGNPGRRPLNTQEPQFETGEIRLPDDFKGDPMARSEWERRAPELIRLGVLTAQDVTEFAAYCRQHSLAMDLWKKLKRLGVERAIARGIFKAFQAADAARSKLGARFGFTPSDRTQIRLDKAKDTIEDPAAKYFGPRLVSTKK